MILHFNSLQYPLFFTEASKTFNLLSFDCTFVGSKRCMLFETLISLSLRADQQAFLSFQPYRIKLNHLSFSQFDIDALRWRRYQLNEYYCSPHCVEILCSLEIHVFLLEPFQQYPSTISFSF